MSESNQSRAGLAEFHGGRLVVDELEKVYKATRAGQEDVLALDSVSFSVEPGELVALVGPSGCGKTTLLKVVAGMLDSTSGDVRIEADGAVKDRVGFVFQQSSLYPWRTLLDNVAFGLELKALGSKRGRRKAARATAAELLTLVGLDGFSKFYPAEVSGGMQQRTNLARGLAIEPSLLLMDEPFSALDAQTREELQIELQRIAIEANTTVLFVTHDIREATYIADKVVVLTPRPGKIKAIVEIPTPRPRPFDYQVSDEFVSISNQLWHLVHENLDSSPNGDQASNGEMPPAG